MAERLPQNRRGLNALARMKLEEVNQPTSPDSLYSLQLMKWALDSGEVEVHPDRQPDLPEQVEAMLGWSQDNAQRFLLGEADAAEELVDQREFRAATPPQAAAMLIQHLHEQMVERVPEYRTDASPLRG